MQVYLSRPRSTVRRPAIWLAGFAVVTAGPGEVRDVDIRIAARAFQHWSVADACLAYRTRYLPAVGRAQRR